MEHNPQSSRNRAGLANVLSMGDPQGLGPLIAGKAWQALHTQMHRPFVLIGDASQMQASIPLAQIETLDAAHNVFSKALPVLHRPIEGEGEAARIHAIEGWIREAVSLVCAGQAGAIITNPINKAVMQRHGFAWPGHTECLADLATPDGGKPARPIMMLVGGGLRVALASIHVSLAQVPACLSADRLRYTAQGVAQALRTRFGIDAPRLAFAGLNPHAGENGVMGDEEQVLINPVAEALRQEGLNISDALPGDTVFHQAREGAFDAVIAMYHDQGLIPVKTLDFHGGVNVTLGLPIVRTSPDHGTAYGLAAKGEGHPGSLIAALKLADSMAACEVS